jgi:DNA repair protein RadC
MEVDMNEYLQSELFSIVPADLSQLVLSGFDDPPVHRSKKRQRQMIAETLARLHQLRDELNEQLYNRPSERPAIHSAQDAYDILRCFLSGLDHEELWVLNLDTRNRLMHLVKLYQGSVNSSQVRVAEVFRVAIVDNAPAILLGHNHPSGDPSPSPDDVGVTRSIVQAGKLLDIEVLDHLVICPDKFVSLRERGLGF